MPRQYKMDLPVNTVNRIRKIFGDLGIMTYEQYWKNVNGKLFSCGVTLEDSNVLRTLGKGTSKEYCLASGYGELMERIENMILLTGNVGISYLDVLKEWPDTVLVHNLQELLDINPKESWDSVKRVCNELLLEEKEDFPNGVYAGKFYSVKDQQTVYLPYSEIFRGVRSNGMCAGNAPEEALVEGLCELMERMAIKSIFTKGVVPPVVPKEYLKQFPSYALIEEIERQGVKVEIRDCSLEKGLPVLGIFTVNEKTGKYKYNFGSHPDFERAIQRCLGEICQVSGGVDSMEEFLAGGMQLSLTKESTQHIENRSDDFDLLSRFYKALKNSNGELPYEYFCGEPSYKFQEWVAFKENENYRQDIQTIVALLEKDGQQVFIRDVSFLGFPAYEIYVTEYSVVQVDQSFKDFKTYLRNRRTKKNEVRMLAKLKKCTEEEKLDLIDFIHLQMNSPKFFNQEKDNNWMREVMGVPVKSDNIRCPQYVLALIELSLKRYQDAYQHFMYAYNKQYISGTTTGYYDVLKVYLEMMAVGKSEDEVVLTLERYYDSTLVALVIEDIRTEKLLKEADILPYVDQRDLSVVCTVYEKLKPLIRESKISMDELKRIFEK